jgi:iduronate 2-sulfatase
MPVAEWKHPRGAMHGLANGEIRGNNVKMEVFQAVDGADTQYPDGHTVNEALNQIDVLTADQTKPFFLAVGILKPHLPFGAPKKYLDLYEGVKLPEIVSPEKPAGVSTWHNSNEFRQYNLWNKDPNEDKAFALEVRKHYAACVSYADAQVGKIIEKLKETNADKNTIIVLWGDHGWNLGEHGIWGKHNLFNEALHSPLIISYPELKKKGQKAMGIVETLDIFPTLCDLTEIEKPDFVQGKSLKPFLNNPKTKGHVAYSYLNAVHSIKTEKYRFIQHDNLELELYDHKTDPHESKNIAANEPKKVAELKKILAEKMAISNWAKGDLK